MWFGSSKGHTEGLEPHVTEELIKLMLSAKEEVTDGQTPAHVSPLSTRLF
jgi:hypothetical protein